LPRSRIRAETGGGEAARTGTGPRTVSIGLPFGGGTPGHAWRIVLPLGLARGVAFSLYALFLALFAAFVAVTSPPPGPATGGLVPAVLIALGVGLHLAWRRWEAGLRTKAMPVGRELAIVAADPDGLEAVLAMGRRDRSGRVPWSTKRVQVPWPAVTGVLAADAWTIRLPGGSTIREPGLIGIRVEGGWVPQPPIPADALEQVFLGLGPEATGRPLALACIEDPEGRPLILLPCPAVGPGRRRATGCAGMRPLLERFVPSERVATRSRVLLDYRERTIVER